MQAALAAALVALLCAQVPASLDDNSTQEDPKSRKHTVAFEEFKKTYHKTYPTPEEEAQRYKIFVKNLVFVEKHNAEEALDGRHGFDTAINKLSDRSAAELTCFDYDPQADRSEDPIFLAPSGVKVNETVDWRKHGYVTGVKFQGGCESCYAFSATGSLEGQHFKKTGKLVSLSEQNLVDCSQEQGNNGCHRGTMGACFTYIIKKKGIDTEASYPYTAKDGTCRYDPSKIGATCKGFMRIRSGDEEALRVAVGTVGPVSVGIDALIPSFTQFHNKTGVYNEPSCSSTRLNHAVLVVGYGVEGGKPYWLVKNSYGTDWGKDGYIKMSRNKNNQCGIATDASYPLV